MNVARISCQSLNDFFQTKIAHVNVIYSKELISRLHLVSQRLAILLDDGNHCVTSSARTCQRQANYIHVMSVQLCLFFEIDGRMLIVNGYAVRPQNIPRQESNHWSSSLLRIPGDKFRIHSYNAYILQ